MLPNFTELCSLIDADIDSLDHDVRRNNIGGSEISAVMAAEDAFLTPLDVWLYKRTGHNPTQENERMRWGRLHEIMVGAYIKKYLEDEIGYLTKASEYFKSPSTKGMGCHPDYFLSKSEEDKNDFVGGIMQVKSTDSYIWNVTYEKEPPIGWLLQVQLELECTGCNWGKLAVLIGGNDLQFFPIERHERTIKVIKESVTDFWKSIERDEPPDPIPERDLSNIKLMCAIHGDEFIDASNVESMNSLADKFDKNRGRVKELLRNNKELESYFIAKMGHAKHLYFEDYRAKRIEISETTIEKHTRKAHERFDLRRR